MISSLIIHHYDIFGVLQVERRRLVPIVVIEGLARLSGRVVGAPDTSITRDNYVI